MGRRRRGRRPRRATRGGQGGDARRTSDAQAAAPSHGGTDRAAPAAVHRGHDARARGGAVRAGGHRGRAGDPAQDAIGHAGVRHVRFQGGKPRIVPGGFRSVALASRLDLRRGRRREGSQAVEVPARSHRAPLRAHAQRGERVADAVARFPASSGVETKTPLRSHQGGREGAAPPGAGAAAGNFRPAVRGGDGRGWEPVRQGQGRDAGAVSAVPRESRRSRPRGA